MPWPWQHSFWHHSTICKHMAISESGIKAKAWKRIPRMSLRRSHFNRIFRHDQEFSVFWSHSSFTSTLLKRPLYIPTLDGVRNDWAYCAVGPLFAWYFKHSEIGIGFDFMHYLFICCSLSDLWLWECTKWGCFKKKKKKKKKEGKVRFLCDWVFQKQGRLKPKT